MRRSLILLAALGLLGSVIPAHATPTPPPVNPIFKVYSFAGDYQDGYHATGQVALYENGNTGAYLGAGESLVIFNPHTHTGTTFSANTGTFNLFNPTAYTANGDLYFNPCTGAECNGTDLQVHVDNGKLDFTVCSTTFACTFHYGSYALIPEGGTSFLSVDLVKGSLAPEPSSLALLGTGALGVFGMARRRFRKA